MQNPKSRFFKLFEFFDHTTMRFVFDDPTKGRSVPDGERVTYTESEVVKVNLARREN